MKDPLIVILAGLGYQTSAAQGQTMAEEYAELERISMLAANPAPTKYYETPQRSKKAPKQWRTK